MSAEDQEMGGGDVGEEEVLDTLLPGSDDEDNFIDEYDAADRKKRFVMYCRVLVRRTKG